MIFVKDNIFEEPDEIRKIGINSKYLQPKFIKYDKNKIKCIDGWRGYRSEINNPFLLKKLKIILTNVCDFYDIKNFHSKFYFHYSLEETKNTCFPSFEEYKYHKDFSDYAGVVYLFENPPKNSGTVIINEKNIRKEFENVYNRLICYPSKFLHAPVDLFGNDISNGRLTLTFFINKK